MSRRARAAVAGSLAAVVWGVQEPLDQRVFGCDYSDVAVLGKGVTRGRHWRTAGLAVSMALMEHLLLYPLCFLVDRYHPARGEQGVPPLLTNRRAFAQATWRHAVFGAVLGRLA